MSSGQSKYILVVNGRSYATPFFKLAREKNLEFTYDPQLLFDNPEQISLVVFTGGEDVSPDLYGRSKHITTFNSKSRDLEEEKIFSTALVYKIPFAGICRGAQFLCVMAGGRLVQDMTGHGGYHRLLVRRGAMTEGPDTREVIVNSSHHQMQYPFDMPEEDYEVIGYLPVPLSRHYSFDKETTVNVQDADEALISEPDIVYYPKIKALATQYHPEWLEENHEGFVLYQNLIDAYLKPLIHDQTRTRTA